jgi:hypothetical protein
MEVITETEDSSDNELDEIETEEAEEQAPKSFKDRSTGNDMADLLEPCKSKCPLKYVSVLMYTSRRSSGVSRINYDAFLRSIS